MRRHHKKHKEKPILKVLYSILSIIFWLFVWYFSATLANRNLLLKIPLPLETFQTLIQKLGNPDFLISIGTSILHILIGFAAAVVIGSVCGILSGSSRFFKTLSSPVLHIVRSVPVAAFIFIAWLWIPSSLLPSVISALMVIPIIWSHIEAGLEAADVRLTEMGRVFGMSKKDTVLHIRIPLIMPHLRTACITGLGIAWKAGVAAEVICNPSGSIGALLQKGKMSVEYVDVFAVTLAVVIISLLMEWVLKLVWKEQKYARNRDSI